MATHKKAGDSQKETPNGCRWVGRTQQLNEHLAGIRNKPETRREKLTRILYPGDLLMQSLGRGCPCAERPRAAFGELIPGQCGAKLQLLEGLARCNLATQTRSLPPSLNFPREQFGPFSPSVKPHHPRFTLTRAAEMPTSAWKEGWQQAAIPPARDTPTFCRHRNKGAAWQPLPPEKPDLCITKVLTSRTVLLEHGLLLFPALSRITHALCLSQGPFFPPPSVFDTGV